MSTVVINTTKSNLVVFYFGCCNRLWKRYTIIKSYHAIMTTPKNKGDKIKAWRTIKDLTQDELVKKVDVPYPTLRLVCLWKDNSD